MRSSCTKEVIQQDPRDVWQLEPPTAASLGSSLVDGAIRLHESPVTKVEADIRSKAK